MGRFGSTKTKKQIFTELGLDTSPEVQKKAKAKWDEIDPKPLAKDKGYGFGRVKKENECFCNEKLLVDITIEVLTDPGPPYVEIYESLTEVMVGTGCEEEKAEFEEYVEVLTDQTPSSLFINILFMDSNNCGKCPPVGNIEVAGFGEVKNPCSFTYGRWMHSKKEMCRCTSIGANPPPPCSCGVMFNIVNGIKYAQKCVLSCNPSTNTCYWRKTIPGVLSVPKPGFVDKPITRWCRANIQPWETNLITDLRKWLKQIGAPQLQGCERVSLHCNKD